MMGHEVCGGAGGVCPSPTSPGPAAPSAAPLTSPAFASIGYVRFIDYEYTGYNYQAFDIGNHFNEFAGGLGSSHGTEGAPYVVHGESPVVSLLCRGERLPSCRWSITDAAPFAGVKEVDYSLYPSKDTQLQWLHSYLQAYKQLTQGNQGVSKEELEALYVQVNKFSLVSGGDGKEPASPEGCPWDGFLCSSAGEDGGAGVSLGVWGHKAAPESLGAPQRHRDHGLGQR